MSETLQRYLKTLMQRWDWSILILMCWWENTRADPDHRSLWYLSIEALLLRAASDKDMVSEDDRDISNAVWIQAYILWLYIHVCINGDQTWKSPRQTKPFQPCKAKSSLFHGHNRKLTWVVNASDNHKQVSLFYICSSLNEIVI